MPWRHSSSYLFEVSAVKNKRLINQKLVRAVRKARHKLPHAFRVNKPVIAAHMSFLYICCLTPKQHAITNMAISKMYRKLPKLPPVHFDRVVCRLDKPNHMSFILLADDASNKRMQRRAAIVERAVEKAGVKLSFHRRQLQPFHITVATTSGNLRSFPFAHALAKVNKGASWPKLELALPLPVGG